MFRFLVKGVYRIYQRVAMTFLGFFKYPVHDVFTGAGSVIKIPEILNMHHKRRILLVTGPHIFQSGLLDDLTEKLEEEGISYTVFNDLNGEPCFSNVQNAVDAYYKGKCQAILAVGGGSPLDCAKLTAASVTRPKKKLRKLMGYLKIRRKMPLFIAVPTTAGTGSEGTSCLVVSDETTSRKLVAVDPVLAPRYAVLDPILTLGLSKDLTANSGMDAITHAIEAYIGCFQSADSRLDAEWAIKLLMENILDAYGAGEDLVARENMLVGSYYAGKAFTRVGVGYIHAFAHAIGGKYGISHGRLVAIILPYVLEWYGDKVTAPLAKLARISGCELDAKNKKAMRDWFIAHIRSLNKQMGIPEKIAELKEEDFAELEARAFKEAHPIYPVPKIMNKGQGKELLTQLLMK